MATLGYNIQGQTFDDAWATWERDKAMMAGGGSPTASAPSWLPPAPAPASSGGYSPSQIYSTAADLSSQGWSNQDIATGAHRLGITADQLSGAYAQARPELFTAPGSAQTMADYTKTLFPGAAPMPPAGGTTTGQNGNGRNQGEPQNPYLSMMANDIQRRSGEALGQGLQGIRSNSVGVGGLGGSRQGVAEGLAIGRSNDNLVGQLSGMFGQAWDSNQNRSVQRYGIDSNANVAMRGQDVAMRGQDQNFYLGNQGQNQQFYTAQRGQDLDSVKLGASLYGLGNEGEWSGINNASKTYQPYTGYSGGGGDGGGPNWSAALGNGMSTYQTGKTNGWW